MKNDILITGGHIIDPARNINEINKLRIINDIIVDADKYPVTSEDPDYPCRRHDRHSRSYRLSRACFL
ncbi:metallo-dependent hydrolase [Salmonella enterica subsp. enterica]|uniref:Metallo-dependent hydrolase n=1 Tax=Salmonella enterica I TaxID=59201 RepID=A0A379X1C5_SALET|nr:metallo-dependent hydrolase [Salmonella enterica subsp. enterica]